MKTKSQRAPSRGAWIDEIWAGVGGFVQLETKTGMTRIGKLSGVRERTFTINGRQQSVPTDLELNGDPTDTLPLDEISRLKIGG